MTEMSSPSFTDNSGSQSSQEIPVPSQSSNLSPRRSSRNSRKERKEQRPPSITPRKFRRFFTPRSLDPIREHFPRHALNQITAPNFNGNAQSSPLRPFQAVDGQENSLAGFTSLKRRKLMHAPEASPEKEYGLVVDEDAKEVGLQSSVQSSAQSSPCERATIGDANQDEERYGRPTPKIAKPRIVPFFNRGLGAQLLDLSSRTSTSTRQYLEYPASDYRDHTASFYSRPGDDVHRMLSTDGARNTIPFCAINFNTNSLVAIGDEDGEVRLLESKKGEKPSFSTTYLHWRVHTNAIIDMTLSKDDLLLATASGDQTARVVDMMTQSTISILGNASASLKQVRFQPGANNNSVLATSSRDGNIQIWDLRCNGYKGPLHQMQAPVGLRITRSQNLLYGKPVKRIMKAHNPLTNQAAMTQIDTPRAMSRELAGRSGDVSVTALQFLSEGQEHILLSGSEADSSIKVWDIRLLHSKQKAQVPLSSTLQPQSHTKWRHFGISSFNLSSDGSRLYSLCKDNTVYAYSTAHLILGHAPELSSSERYPKRDEQQGLGPLYGFRHPEMLTSSFYVKSALRPAKDGKCEMLAVGSNNGCAVLFPTDEKCFPKQHHEEPPSRKLFSECPRVVAGRVNDNIPILTHGTPLIRGHNDREVGSLSWTNEGDLITVGDDFVVRLWREDGEDARELRTAEEFGGSRWGCGWADVGADYDDEDEDLSGDTTVDNIAQDKDLDEDMSD